MLSKNHQQSIFNRTGSACKLTAAFFLTVKALQLLFVPTFAEQAQQGVANFAFILEFLLYTAVYCLVLTEPKLRAHLPNLPTWPQPKQRVKRTVAYDERKDMDYLDDMFEADVNSIKVQLYAPTDEHKTLINAPEYNVAEAAAPLAYTATEYTGLDTPNDGNDLISDRLASYPVVLLSLAFFALVGLNNALVASFETLPFVAILTYVLIQLYIKYGRRNRLDADFFGPIKIFERGLSRILDRSRLIIYGALGVTIIAFLIHLIASAFYFYTRSTALQTPNFDYGIFSQAISGIFHYGQPVTTLERGRELSHFAVHFSPILYFFAPFYALVPHVSTINLLQLLPVLAAVIPLNAAMKLKKLQPLTRYLILAIYLLSPGQIFSSFYDFHENCFLSFGVITLFYFIVKGHTLAVFLGSFLVLGIKEDAFVYVAALALWQIFEAYEQRNKRKLRQALGLLAFAICYFIITTQLMAHYGLGTMENSRFANILAPNTSGFFELLKVMLERPAYVIRQILAPEKMNYVYLMLLTSGLVLIWNTNYKLNFLALPMVLVNLLSNWPYQYDIGFQYHYGSAALLIILLILSLHNLSRERKTAPAAVAPLDTHGESVSTIAVASAESVTDDLHTMPTQGDNVLSSAPPSRSHAQTRILPPLFSAVLAVTLCFTATYSVLKLKDKVTYANSFFVPKMQDGIAIEERIGKLDKHLTYLTTSFLASAFRDFRYVYELDNLRGDFDFADIDVLVIDRRGSFNEQMTERLNKIISEQGFKQSESIDKLLDVYERV